DACTLTEVHAVRQQAGVIAGAGPWSDRRPVQRRLNRDVSLIMPLMVLIAASGSRISLPSICAIIFLYLSEYGGNMMLGSPAGYRSSTTARGLEHSRKV